MHGIYYCLFHAHLNLSLIAIAELIVIYQMVMENPCYFAAAPGLGHAACGLEETIVKLRDVARAWLPARQAECCERFNVKIAASGSVLSQVLGSVMIEPKEPGPYHAIMVGAVALILGAKVIFRIIPVAERKGADAHGREKVPLGGFNNFLHPFLADSRIGQCRGKKLVRPERIVLERVPEPAIALEFRK